MRTPSTATFLALAALPLTALVAIAAKPPADVPVVATLADTASGAWLRVGSDTQGAYVTTSQTTSIIQQRPTGTDWLLTTYYTRRGSFAPSTRGVRFDLSEQHTSGAFPTPIAGVTTMPVQLKVGCSHANVDMLGLTQGQSVICPGSYRFWAPNGHWYRLAFNADNYPEVDGLTVTCTTAVPTGCKIWTITPSGAPTLADANPKNHTRLVEIDEDGFVVAEGGTYYVSFAITLAR